MQRMDPLHYVNNTERKCKTNIALNIKEEEIKI